jgi:hypothetical protein
MKIMRSITIRGATGTPLRIPAYLSNAHTPESLSFGEDSLANADE